MSIHRLVHYLLRGNAADIHDVDKSSILSKPDGHDQNWLKGTSYLSIFIIYN